VITLFCPKHRRYTAKRAPNCDCDVCWALFHISRGNMNTATTDCTKAAHKQQGFKLLTTSGGR
jgi:hypothetical protein